jgi:hypothetical protein
MCLILVFLSHSLQVEMLLIFPDKAVFLPGQPGHGAHQISSRSQPSEGVADPALFGMQTVCLWQSR